MLVEAVLALKPGCVVFPKKTKYVMLSPSSASVEADQLKVVFVVETLELFEGLDKTGVVGASFTGFTVTLIASEFEFTPSEAKSSLFSEPLKFFPAFMLAFLVL